MSAASPEGILVVVVLKARNLRDKHSFYKQDVFAQLSLGGESKKTHVDVKGGQHPVWDAELRFSVYAADKDKSRMLDMSCYAKEPRLDDLIAQASLDIGDTLRTGEFDDWVVLTEPNGTKRGELYLEMTYFSNAAAPPQIQIQKPPTHPSTSNVKLDKPDLPPRHGPHFAPQMASDMNAPIQRRPSRLTPAERLSRAPPPASLMPSHPGSSLRPPVVNGAAPLAQQSHPSPPHAQTPLPSRPVAGHVPSLLRPGNPKSDPQPRPSSAYDQDLREQTSAHGHRPSRSYGDENQFLNPYESTSQPQVANTGYSPPMTYYGNGYNPPQQPSSGRAAFPIPSVPHGAGSSYPNPPNAGRVESDLPDPYLIARYQSPLPLPPSASTNKSTPIPPASVVHQADPRVQALQKEEEDIRRRKEQEDRDLELARQLDRELNLGSAT